MLFACSGARCCHAMVAGTKCLEINTTAQLLLSCPTEQALAELEAIIVGFSPEVPPSGAPAGEEERQRDRLAKAREDRHLAMERHAALERTVAEKQVVLRKQVEAAREQAADDEAAAAVAQDEMLLIEDEMEALVNVKPSPADCWFERRYRAG